VSREVFVEGGVFTAEAGEVDAHLPEGAVGLADAGFGEPGEGGGVAVEFFDGDRGVGEEVEEGGLAEGEVSDQVFQIREVGGPGGGEAFEGGAGAGGVEGGGGFFGDPSFVRRGHERILMKEPRRAMLRHCRGNPRCGNDGALPSMETTERFPPYLLSRRKTSLSSVDSAAA